MRNLLVPRMVLGLGLSTLLVNDISAQSLEEIIVTSQRREESIQSVPIAVTAFTGEALEQLGVNDLQAMADFVPNISIGDGTGRSNVGAQFSIRGVNEARISPVLDPAVGVYIDDVYYGRPLTNFLRLLDVERVEVLRGPQGTLFGKNSTGGAIRYVTVKPSVEDGVTGKLKLGLGERDRIHASGSINVPISDTIAARFSAAHMEEDGWVKRVSDGVGLGEDDTDHFAAQIRFQPSEQLTADFSVSYTEASSNGGASKLIDYFGYNGGFDDPSTPGIEGDTTAPIFTGGISALAAFNILFPEGTPEHYAPEIPNSLYHVAGTGRIGSTNAESTGVGLDITYEISDTLSIRSITGYRDVESFEDREADESIFAESFFDNISLQTVDFWSQEFQLNGIAMNDTLTWVAGVFYSKEEPSLRRLREVDYRVGGDFGSLQKLDDSRQETESLGVFAQADWQFSPSMTLTLGVRYSEDDKSFSTLNRGVFTEELDQRLFEIHALDPNGPDDNSNYRDIRPGPATIFINPDGDTYGSCTPSNPCFLDTADNIVATHAESVISGGETFSSVTPRIALEWQASDDLMVYGAASKGFKSGGTNDSVADVDTPFDPEELWSYEVGARFQSENGRIRANLTAFTMDYMDKQLTVTTSNRCVNRCTTNVGDATISGIELEMLALISDSLLFNMGLGTLDAEWDDIQNPTAGVEEDSDFSRAPELSFNLGLTHTWDLETGGVITSSINYAYKDEQQSSGQDSTTLTIPEYDLFNLRIGYTSSEGNWKATLFCSNCADEEYITGGAAWAGSTDGTDFNFKPSTHPAYVADGPDGSALNPRGNAPPGITLVNIGAPRTLGVDFTYSF